jgi:molybdopterin-guanine dinucleotide biosynthesis protein A
VSGRAPRLPVTGVILAGGRSSRFGSDKASALLRGRPLLEWVTDAVSEVCDELVVVRAQGQSLPTIESPVPLSVVDDEYDARGPLAGLVTGMHAARHPLCFAAACDAPLLRPAVIRLLPERIGGADTAVPLVEGLRQPLVALYRREKCLSVFERQLAAGNGRILDSLHRLRVADVPETAMRQADPHLDSFRNANRPEVLAAIEQRLACR